MENTFGIPIIPTNEEERLVKLYGYNILEGNEKKKAGRFKHVAAMAAHIFQVPIALVAFVDKERVVIKANIGMEDKDEVGRGEGLCSLAILKDEVTVFEDAKKEPWALANPLVAGSFGLRFYAAAPLITPDGYKIGVVCVVDKKARKFPEAEQQLLEGLASIVMEELEERQLLKNL